MDVIARNPEKVIANKFDGIDPSWLLLQPPWTGRLLESSSAGAATLAAYFARRRAAGDQTAICR